MGYAWAKAQYSPRNFERDLSADSPLMQDAELMGLDISQLGAARDEAEEDECGFELLDDGEEAYCCFTRYLSREWTHGFNGIEGFNTLSALAVISRIKTKPKAQLKLLEQVSFIAAGALAYFQEQREKQKK